jgi:hypothetical protein
LTAQSTGKLKDCNIRFFTEWWKTFHWSLKGNENPDSLFDYSEPVEDNEDGLQEKARTQKQTKKV